MENCIIDVGADTNGSETKKMRRGNTPIIFLEPNLKAFSRLQIEPYDMKLPMAIHKENGVVEFNLYQEGTHSILETNVDRLPHFYIDGYSGNLAVREAWVPRKTIVPCIRLDTLINQLGIKHVEFLKIDTQGYDFEVIKSLGDKIGIVDSLVCEVQITAEEVYLNSSKKSEIMEYMTARGFKLAATQKQTFDQEENLFFIRERRSA